MYSVTRTFTFEAAHRLTKLEKGHPCTNLHGHSYKVQIEVFSTKLDDYNFVTNFDNIKVVEDLIKKSLDHAIILNSTDSEILEFCNKMNFKTHVIDDADPTAEIIAKFIYNVTKQHFNNENYLYKINVWETEKNFATYIEK